MSYMKACLNIGSISLQALENYLVQKQAREPGYMHRDYRDSHNCAFSRLPFGPCPKYGRGNHWARGGHSVGVWRNIVRGHPQTSQTWDICYSCRKFGHYRRECRTLLSPMFWRSPLRPFPWSNRKSFGKRFPTISKFQETGYGPISDSTNMAPNHADLQPLCFSGQTTPRWHHCKTSALSI